MRGAVRNLLDKMEMMTVRHEATICMIVILLMIAMVMYLGSLLAVKVMVMAEQQQAQYTEILDEAVPLGQ